MIQTRKNEHRLLSILLGPIISEKATMVAEKNEQVVFEVARDANKLEIKGAVELLFKVEVKSVQVVIQKGKAKKFGRFEGRRNHVKKVPADVPAANDYHDGGHAETVPGPPGSCSPAAHQPPSTPPSCSTACARTRDRHVAKKRHG